MWQIYAMMAQDQINEQLHEAEVRRRNAVAPRAPREPRHFHLPAVFRHPARPSSRSV